MVFAQVLQATFPTSSHATWAEQFLAEQFLADRFFAELYGSDGVEVSASRPSNAPGHANRCTNQNADALRSCSCRTLKLLMVWSPPTSTQQSPRRARVAPFRSDTALLRPKYHLRVKLLK